MARRTKKPSLNVIIDRLTYQSDDGPSIGRLPYRQLTDFTTRILEAANLNTPITREDKHRATSLKIAFEDILEEILDPDHGCEVLHNYPRPDNRYPSGLCHKARVYQFPTSTPANRETNRES